MIAREAGIDLAAFGRCAGATVTYSWRGVEMATGNTFGVSGFVYGAWC